MDKSRIEREAADEFDRWAASGRGERMGQGHRPVVEPVLDRWPLGPDDAVLDVGCGSGWLVRECLSRGAGQAVGVDLSPAFIAEARERGGTFEVASGDALPFTDGTFSHVLSVESLYYYPSPVDALREWLRVTRPGGQMAVVIELFADNRGSAVWHDILDIHTWLWSEAEWAEVTRQAGWQDVRTERIVRQGGPGPESDFSPSKHWPSYQHWKDYWEAGALFIGGQR